MFSRKCDKLCGRSLSDIVKKGKNTLVLLGMFVFLFSEIGTYNATEQLYLQEYEVEKQDIKISCASITEETTPAKEQFQAKLGGKELAIHSVSTVKDTQMPITYYCLVDVSGSMREHQMEQVRSMLKTISDSLKEGDNMVISTLGNQVHNSGVLADKTQILAEIEKLVIGTEDTNLYAGIVETVNQITTGAQINQEKCILIFSDGKDDQKSGITQQEAQDSIKNANIPVYTVAFVKDLTDAEQVENAKLLGSFARNSAGGKHYAPEVDNISTEDITNDILRLEQSGLILTADISNIKTEKEMLLLVVSYTGEENRYYEDTMEVLAQDLTKEESTQNAQKETQKETEKKDKDDKEDDNKKDDNKKLILFIGVGAGILLLIAIIIVILLKRKKKNKEVEYEQKTVRFKMEEPEFTQTVQVQRNEQEIKPERKETPQKVESRKITRSREKQYVLRLYAIGYNSITYSIVLEEGKDVTVGRNNKANIAIACDDRKLSSVHCMLKVEKGRLQVLDMGSKNGTYVNGISIQTIGKVGLHSGETLRIGSYEYRIQFEERNSV